jgi:hypothetical protein
MLEKTGCTMNINVEPYINPKILADLKHSLTFKPVNRKLRLVRIPVLEFASAMDKILSKNPHMPFRPVIFDNIPVDSTVSELPECVLVADDNTNITRSGIIETEFYKGGN